MVTVSVEFDTINCQPSDRMIKRDSEVFSFSAFINGLLSSLHPQDCLFDETKELKGTSQNETLQNTLYVRSANGYLTYSSIHEKMSREKRYFC